MKQLREWYPNKTRAELRRAWHHYKWMVEKREVSYMKKDKNVQR
jgi:hypothetical protein